MERCGPMVGQPVLKTGPRESDEGSTPWRSAKILQWRSGDPDGLISRPEERSTRSPATKHACVSR